MSKTISGLITEQRHHLTQNIDQLPTGEILQLINNEDQLVPQAVEKVIPQIEQAVNAIYLALSQGGSLIYIGAGTSGRLGILDASECPPTFRTDPDLVKAVIAGGDHAIKHAIEGAEDNLALGKQDLVKQQLTSKDIVVGITASGRTPYVIGALEYAKRIGAKTVALSSNMDAVVSEIADYPIEVVVGPEILAGSTRMKAGTAHKLVLNMITTTVMIKLGKVYENLMVDVNASNAKLKERARQIIMQITGISYTSANDILAQTNYEVKPAIVMVLGNVTYEKAQQALDRADGYVRKAINLVLKEG